MGSIQTWGNYYNILFHFIALVDKMSLRCQSAVGSGVSQKMRPLIFFYNRISFNTKIRCFRKRKLPIWPNSIVFFIKKESIFQRNFHSHFFIKFDWEVCDFFNNIKRQSLMRRRILKRVIMTWIFCGNSIFYIFTLYTFIF